MFNSPLWLSPFRPFYLLGCCYAPWLALWWLGGAFAGWEMPAFGPSPKAWHGHEMIFGFSLAIIAGIVLTALPSWAGTPEITGGKLALLVGAWLAGRLAVWSAGLLPPLVVVAIDSLLPTLMAAMLAPQLIAVRNRLYLLLLPILVALIVANARFHLGVADGDPGLAEHGLRLGLYAVIALYVLKGGVLAPIFTANALRERGLDPPRPCSMPLEFAALASLLLLAGCDLGAAPAPATGAAAFACALLQAIRCARWRGWQVADLPLLLVMHLGFVWLIAALVLRAAAEFGLAPRGAWIHAFTVGSLGMMMLGLLTRVSLRHTGRPLRPPRPVLAGFALVCGAAGLRVAAAWWPQQHLLAAAATVLWAAAFVACLISFATIWLAPSLPRSAVPEPAVRESR